MARAGVMKFNEYSSRAEWADAVGNIVAAQLSDALDSRGRATLIVPGGTTPALMFDTLRRQDINWNAVCVIPSDERLVSLESTRSNLGMIKARLLQDKAKRAEIISLCHSGKDSDEFLKDVEKQLSSKLPPDVTLLGMGEDMHTASLFPRSDELDDALSSTGRFAIPVTAPMTGERRVTLTYRSLSVSRNLHVLITGQAKKHALQKASRIANPKDAPVSAFLASASVHFAA